MSTTTRKLTPSVSLLDETADFKRTADYALYLTTGPGSFSFAILHKAQNKFVALESYNLQQALNPESLSKCLTDLIADHGLLSLPFEHVWVGYDSSRSTLVPEALFDAAQASTYIQFNHVSDPGDIVMTDTLTQLDARNIYLLPEAVKKAILALYPKARFRHSSSALLESQAIKYKNETKPKLVVHISLLHFEIILFEGKHLRFYNTFRHQTSEDFMYYLLFVCEQLKLNPENLELILIGEVEKNSAIYSMLYKYVRNIRFGDRPEAFTYCHPMKTLPGHFYTTLFSQPLFN
ncbi:MAG TPA: DUF3822 family protein [Bacteroidia bacterium]|jgi:hypothetical protein|nr:DUF3822 family protein [Bacteroidia bacterium]